MQSPVLSQLSLMCKYLPCTIDPATEAGREVAVRSHLSRPKRPIGVLKGLMHPMSGAKLMEPV